MDDDPLPDWNAALDQIGGSVEILHSVAGTFIQSCPEMMDKIVQSAEAGDMVELRRAAHTLKGSVAIFGARPAHDVSLELEQLAREGSLEKITEAISRVEAEIGRLMPMLQARLESG